MAEQILSVVLPYIHVVIGVILVILGLLSMIKVASGNEVLVVTGVGATKKVDKKITVLRNGREEVETQTTYEPKIKVAGAAVVIPFIQQARRFDICVKKAKKDNDTMKTRTGVEIVIDWSISYAPNADSVETLQPCIRQFLDKDDPETEDIVMSSVAGGMRAVISTMTPQQVMVGKETLDEAVQKNIASQMTELGYKVQIYIQEVRDARDSTYYRDLAAEDREKTRQSAATIAAEADQNIRQKQALAEQAARQSELDSDVAVAERERDTSLKKAAFKAEIDQAQADASIAGEMRTTERKRELTEKEGAVEVMRQEQAKLAAAAEQTVKVTQAETAKKESVIGAEAEAERCKIEAAAAAAVKETQATGEANAAKVGAAGAAEAAKLKATGEADAVRLSATAEAEKIRLTGEAEATAIRAKGEAEAAAIGAKGKAEAEAAKALSDAQAANDRVNFEIAKLEIQRDTQIQVATSIATVMARIGENAKFYDFGGSSGEAGDGSDLLTRVMSNIPQLFAKANLKNEALNGEQLPETIRTIIESMVDPLGDVLKGIAAPANSNQPNSSKEPDDAASEPAAFAHDATNTKSSCPETESEPAE